MRADPSRSVGTSTDTPAIEDHALIGDTRTAALVTRRGEIDWLCFPRFESAPVFGSLIGGEGGGSFAVSPRGLRSVQRRYLERSAVVETTWETSSGKARLTDGMVADISGALLPQLLMVRRLEGLEGSVAADVTFDPRRDLRVRPRRSGRRAGALFADWGSLALALRTEPDLQLTMGLPREVNVGPGETVTFALSAADREAVVLVSPSRAWELLAQADRWWRAWSERIDYDGPGREAVLRSILTLRLLTYAPSGAPVAAPTTSLPDEIGGESNWDYRFSWPRDASMGVSGFRGLGYRTEPRAFLHWLAIASRLSRPRVNVLYDLEGRTAPEERERRDVPGYLESLPVRLGNAAGQQHQLDVYGWIVDAAWQLHNEGERFDRTMWRAVEGWADFVCKHWREPDSGIWEKRGEPQHYVHSKAMGWLALDRAIKMSAAYRVRRSRLERWISERSAIRQSVLTRGVDPARGIYVGRYGTAAVDAALLTLPSIGIEEPSSSRMLATVRAIRSDLDAGDGLLYRYPSESGERPGAFLACSFWLVEALCRLDLLDEATELFESLCERSNDVGLFAERIDPSSGRHLGNFPQALTHSALVGAALALGDATKGRSAARA